MSPAAGQEDQGPRPALIAFEGLDGTGKSRLTTLLSEATGIRRAATPAPEYAALRHTLHQAGGLAAYLMYLSSCVWAVESASRAGEAGLVLDRYWFSSAVQHGWNQGQSPAQALFGPAAPQHLLPQPDLTVLLVADRAARLRRVGGRPTPNSSAGPALGDCGRAYEEYWLSCAELLSLETRSCGTVVVLDTTSDDCSPPLARLLDHPVVQEASKAAAGRLATGGALR